MTTTNRTTPATAAQLTEIFDGILKAPASAPNTSAIEPPPGKDALLSGMAALLPKRRPQPPCPPAAPAPAAPAAPTAPAVVLTEAGASPLPVYPWEPMPTSGDPCGLRERMQYVEAAIAARAVPTPSAAPHTRAAGGPVSPLVEARFVEAHRRLIDMLG